MSTVHKVVKNRIKINSKINDIEYELNKAINERNNPKTEYERAVELNRLMNGSVSCKI